MLGENKMAAATIRLFINQFQWILNRMYHMYTMNGQHKNLETEIAV